MPEPTAAPSERSSSSGSTAAPPPEASSPPDRSGVDPLADLRLDPPTWAERVDQALAPLLESPLRAAGAAALVVAVAAVAGWLFFLRPAEPPPLEDTLPMAPAATAPAAVPTTTASTAATLVAHAAGAVISPGVYELPAGARVADLIEAAGGLAPDADPDRLNLAGPLADGTRVFVPRQGQPVPDEVAGGGAGGATTRPPGAPSGGGAGGADADELVDLNQADATELETLPGVGPATAQAIIDHRTEHGPFTSVDDLIDVHGIGEAKLARLRELVRV